MQRLGVSTIRAFVAPLGVLVCLAPAGARACRAQSVSLADAVAAADTLIAGQVVSSRVTSPRRTGTTATLSIRVRVSAVIAGSARPKSVLELAYSEPMPVHNRGGRTYCPMWVGSGIEFNLDKRSAYHLLTSAGRLVRAVPAAQAKGLLKAWAARHWSYVLPTRAKRATVVMRVTVVKNKRGSKTRWTKVRPSKTFKNASGQRFKGPLDIAQLGTSRALEPGTYTVYLEPYASRSKRWKLLDGRPSSGTSHFQRPTPPRGR